MRVHTLLALVLYSLLISGCGGGGSSSSSNLSSGNPMGSVPQFDHVAIVLLENASYSNVIGNGAMPYLNGLASKYSLLQSYYAVGHPSIPNYFMLTTGQTITFEDSYTSEVTVDNLAREFIASGVTWKAYEESIPSVGYTGTDSGFYFEHHDPFSYFQEVRGSTTQAANLVPFTQLSVDLSTGSLPNFIWITPNALDDAHSCPTGNPGCTLNERLATADSWLNQNIQPLLNNASFSASGLLVIVFDESEATDTAHGGGHVACILAGTHVKTGYTSTAMYSHPDVLGLIAHALRLQTIPGAGATGASMTEFFQ